MILFYCKTTTEGKLFAALIASVIKYTIIENIELTVYICRRDFSFILGIFLLILENLQLKNICAVKEDHYSNLYLAG